MGILVRILNISVVYLIQINICIGRKAGKCYDPCDIIIKFRSASTMNRKTLDENMGVDQFNKKLFAASMEMITKCRKIPVGLVSEHYKN